MGIRLDIAGGINTSTSPDQLQAGWPYIANVRRILKSRTVARPPLGANQLASALPAGPTSVSRLGDPYLGGSGYALVIGAAGKMYVNASEVASGLSGAPLSFLNYRPTGTPRPYCYTGDASLAVTLENPSYASYGTVAGMVKARADGTVWKTGIKEPQTAPAITTSGGTSPIWVIYRYVYRDSRTQALSNPSPESFPAVVPQASVQGSFPGSSYATNLTYNTSQYEYVSVFRTKGISPGILTDYIVAYNFGLSVPTGVTINGVQIAINWGGQYAGTGVWANAALFYQGQILGQVKSPGILNQQFSGSSGSTAVQGGNSDAWGTVLTPTICNDTSFGFGIQILTQDVNTSDRSFFYTFTITVYYTSLSATGTCVSSLDPQVDTIDVYRQDPGLDNFTYTLSVPNSAPSFTDTLSDLQISSNPILQYDNFEPFPSIDLPRSGTCNVTAVNEQVTSVGIATPGSGQTDGTYNINASSGGGSGAVAQIVILGGIITSAVVTFPGSGYTSAPTFTVSHGGTPGTLTAAVGPILPLTANIAWVSGDLFNIRWLPGTVVLINGIAYQLYNRPPSTTTMLVYRITTTTNGYITFGYPPAASGVTFQLPTPELANEPSPVIWGPTPDNAGSFYFGLDPNNPGDLVWSKGNNFDSAPDTNRLSVTSPSEPIMNGTITSMLSTVFSTERFWLIYPNFSDAVASVTGTLGQQWVLIQSASTRGLYMRYAIGALGTLTAWRAKDGIFVSMGGGPEQSITDAIYNLFPHGGQQPSAITVGGNTIYPPDDTRPNAQIITVIPDYIFYDYQDTNGTPRTLVYDMEAKGWSVDSYTPAVNCHSWAVGDVYQTLTGCTDGTVRAFDSTATELSSAVIMTRAENLGSTRVVKRLSGVFLRAVASVAINLAFYANRIQTAITGFVPAVTGTGPSETDYLTDFTPATNTDLKDLACQFTWPVGSPNILSEWQPDWTQLPQTIIGWHTGLLSYGQRGWMHIEWLDFSYSALATVNVVATLDTGQTFTIALPSTAGAQAKSFNLPPALKFKLVGWTVNSTQPFTLFAESCECRIAVWGVGTITLKPFSGAGFGSPEAST
jgi:hypothetical protein